MDVTRVNYLTAIVKIIIFIAIIALFCIPLLYNLREVVQLQKTSKKKLLISTLVPRTYVQGIGYVNEPLIDLEIKTVNGYQKNRFLLDSGAVISSLPYEMAAELGQNPAFLPRLAFRGFGNTTAFAYQGTMSVKFTDQEVSFPVVFTEANASKLLIGRKGFFDRYNISFDPQGKLEIYQ